MLQLTNLPLKAEIKAELERFQAIVDSETLFAQKAEKAKELWKSKENTNLGKDTFEQIKSHLKEMCVGTEICNYCEGNEANDIEHIAPKSFFPELAFVWENYLLACKQCNSAYKLDKCYVMDGLGNVHETVRKSEPTHKQIAMINPRIENPSDFLWLNLAIWEFEINEDLQLQNFHKADKTLEILALNKREYLKAARKASAQEYYNIMDRLRLILNATDLGDIEDALNPHQEEILQDFDRSLPIETIKEHIKQSTNLYIQHHRHPSVWYAIKTISSHTNAKWQRIFRVIPEALDW